MTHYVHQGNQITLNWTVRKGAGLAQEDFSRIGTGDNDIVLFLINKYDRIRVACEVDAEKFGQINALIDTENTGIWKEGVYSVELVWWKNGETMHARDVQRTRVDNLFCLTTNQFEADSEQAPVLLRLNTVAHAYGYDGLSAYEIACLRGTVGGTGEGTWLSEKEWVQIRSERIEESQIADGAVTTEKMADGAVTGRHVAPGAVTADKIAQGTLDEMNLALNLLAVEIDDETGDVDVYYGGGSREVSVTMDEETGDIVIHRTWGDGKEQPGQTDEAALQKIEGLGGSVLGPNSVGSEEIKDGSIRKEDLSPEVQESLEEEFATTSDIQALFSRSGTGE